MPKGTPDEQFNDRIKSMEQRIAGRNQVTNDRKPKDLLRAIGKIESNDWNLRQIEKKIEESKKTEVGKSREKVPKWSKEQFLQRQNKLTRPDDPEADERFKDIDQTIKNAEKQLKDGALREIGERGKNKVASIAGNFIKKDEANEKSDEKLPKSVSSRFFFLFNRLIFWFEKKYQFFLHTISEFKIGFGIQFTKNDRHLSFLQAKGVRNGKIVSRRIGIAS